MAKACENWASALLLHLLSDSSGSQTSALGHEAEVNNKTAELAQHILQLQCTPAYSRPALAASLRRAMIASLDELAEIETSAAQHDTVHTGSARTAKSQMREADHARHEMMSSGAETDSSSDELRSHASLDRVTEIDDDIAGTHGLRFADSFPVEAAYTNKWTNDYFLLNEPSAARAIFEASTESDVLLPSYVIFDGTTGPISTLRLASFTGTRFFRSIFAQLQASPRQSAPHHRPSHHQRSLRSSARAHAGRPDACRACFRVSDWGNRVRLDAVSADTLDLLLRLMEGKAPARVTLRQACELFGALDYCLAQNLAAAVVYYLGPLIMALTPKEVAWLLARSVPHVAETEMADRALEIIKSYGAGPAAGVRLGPPSSTASAAHCEVEVCINEASCVDAAIFAGRELARCGRGKPYTRALLKICWQEGVPRWIRVSALAAACATAGGSCDGACDGAWTHRQMLKEMTDATDVLLAAYPREVGTMRTVFQQACLHAAADCGGHIAMQALAAVLHRIAVFAPRAVKPPLQPASTGGGLGGAAAAGGSVAGPGVGRLPRPSTLSWAGHLRRHARADAGSGVH